MTDKLVLYSFRRCPFAIRVRMVLEEKNIVYHAIEEKLSHLSSELLSMHPQAKVPLLVHYIGDMKYVIYQSSVITEYLEDAYLQNTLMPKEALDKMQVRLWTYWCDNIFKPDLDIFKYKLSNLEASEQEILILRLHSHFAKWEKTLRESSYLVGNTMTLADIHLFPFARQFFGLKQSTFWQVEYPRTYSWLSTMISRPAFERAMRN